MSKKINVFNREELYIGFSRGEMERICEALKKAGIEYKAETVGRGSIFTGRIDNKSDCHWYYVYVAREDLETARSLAR